MERPEPNVMTSEEDMSNVAPAVSWGEKELAREIALLEASICEGDLSRSIDELASLVGSPPAVGDVTVIRTEEDLRKGYSKYVKTVINGQALALSKAIAAIQEFTRRISEVFSHLECYSSSSKNELTAALAIRRLQISSNATSKLLLRLQKSANSALFRVPLFAYGPELSEFRHRLR